MFFQDPQYTCCKECGFYVSYDESFRSKIADIYFNKSDVKSRGMDLYVFCSKDCALDWEENEKEKTDYEE